MEFLVGLNELVCTKALGKLFGKERKKNRDVEVWFEVSELRLKRRSDFGYIECL